MTAVVGLTATHHLLLSARCAATFLELHAACLEADNDTARLPQWQSGCSFFTEGRLRAATSAFGTRRAVVFSVQPR